MLKRMEGHKHSTDDERVNELIKVNVTSFNMWNIEN